MTRVPGLQWAKLATKKDNSAVIDVEHRYVRFFRSYLSSRGLCLPVRRACHMHVHAFASVVGKDAKCEVPAVGCAPEGQRPCAGTAES